MLAKLGQAKYAEWPTKVKDTWKAVVSKFRGRILDVGQAGGEQRSAGRTRGRTQSQQMQSHQHGLAHQ
eukprot:7115437-Alexandrium_andersonii.AAC.1